MGRDMKKKNDCGGFIVLQIPFFEKRKILIGQLPVSLSSNPSECHWESHRIKNSWETEPL